MTQVGIKDKLGHGLLGRLDRLETTDVGWQRAIEHLDSLAYVLVMSRTPARPTLAA